MARPGQCFQVKNAHFTSVPAWMCVCTSGVARLGHTGARALATRGRAPPVQVFMRIVVVRESGAKRSLNRTAHYRNVYSQNYESCMLTIRRVTYTALRYGLTTGLGGCKISWESMPQPSLNAYTLRAEFRTNVVCPCCALASAMSWLRHWFAHGSMGDTQHTLNEGSLLGIYQNGKCQS